MSSLAGAQSAASTSVTSAPSFGPKSAAAIAHLAPILDWLGGVEKEVKRGMETFDVLGPESEEALEQILELITLVRENVEDDIKDSQDDRGDLQVLLDFEHSTWAFKTDSDDNAASQFGAVSAMPTSDLEAMQAYRSRALKVNHAEFHYTEGHKPVFLSRAPLPADLPHKTTVSVRLPEGVSSLMQSVRVEIMLSGDSADTTDSVVHKVFEKFDKTGSSTSLGDPLEFCLKMWGSHEYLDGRHPISAFDRVRYLLRQNEAVELLLVKRPEAPTNQEPPHSDEYEKIAKANGLRAVLSHNSFPPLGSMSGKVRGELRYERDMQLTFPWDKMPYVPISDLHMPFRVRMAACEGVSAESLPLMQGAVGSLRVYVRTFLFHGVEQVPNSDMRTPLAELNFQTMWNRWLSTSDEESPVYLDMLPRGTRVAVLLYLVDDNTKISKKTKDIRGRLLAFGVHQLIDRYGHFTRGKQSMRLWQANLDFQNCADNDDFDFVYRFTNRENWARQQQSVATLHYEFDEFALPVVSPMFPSTAGRPPKGPVPEERQPTTAMEKIKHKFDEVMAKDPLNPLNAKEREMVWKFRHYLQHDPSALCKFLLCVDWDFPSHVAEAHRMLRDWAKPTSPVQALALLDVQHHDIVVREYAVRHLRTLTDHELQLYLLQLTQVLKFEPYHDSALARFLVERALRSPYQVGHYLFWHLKAEMVQAPFAERFALILEEYLTHCGSHLHELRVQHDALKRMQHMAEHVAKMKNDHKDKEDIMRSYRTAVGKFNRTFATKHGTIQIPLDPRVRGTTLVVEKCKYMSSKMAPLWLVFNNADKAGPRPYVIFKSGDDLRQDILTLQLLKVMDDRWLSEGLDMRMKPYNVIATGVNAAGKGVGMIEVVLNSVTTSHIQHANGGAFDMRTLNRFLESKNKGIGFLQAVQNFVHSCAGYCVATFVLGIGDRHNDNIMLAEDGHLFHIDFGHFLGNFKSKMGVKRERSAFVLTPEMAFVMGGKDYKSHPDFQLFQRLCFDSFNILRKHGTDLINLFLLMISAGMPELLKASDVLYMRQQLMLEKSDKHATNAFKKEIARALGNTFRLFDNWVHNKKHRGR